MFIKRLKALYIIIEFGISVAIVILLMRMFNKKNRFFRKWWAKLQRYLIGYSLEIVGKPDKDAKLLLINHQSMMDIVVLEDNYPADIAWVAKKEIADIPLYGQILTVPDMIIIDRESKSSLIKLFKEAKDRVSKGRVIAIFPEGTRGRGDKLLKFRSGSKLLAEKLKLKVQPIVIVGTRELLDSQNFKASLYGKIKVIYLDSVDPTADEDWYEKLYENMKETLAKHTKLT
jgi:1-acyl-sn-glycerol-3-phosphate acyltransferase